jgi:hypothetical protein
MSEQFHNNARMHSLSEQDVAAGAKLTRVAD